MIIGHGTHSKVVSKQLYKGKITEAKFVSCIMFSRPESLSLMVAVNPQVEAPQVDGVLWSLQSPLIV